MRNQTYVEKQREDIRYMDGWKACQEAAVTAIEALDLAVTKARKEHAKVFSGERASAASQATDMRLYGEQIAARELAAVVKALKGTP